MARVLATVRVELGDRSYDIRVGAGLFERAGPSRARLVRTSPAAIITHSRLARLHGVRVARVLRELERLAPSEVEG